MTIWDKYQAVLRLMNRDVRGQALRVSDFNIYAQLAEISYYKLKFGLPEEYQPGVFMPRQAWQVTSKITDDTRPYWKKKTLYPKNGQVDLPPDYGHLSTIYRSLGNNRVIDIEVLNDDEYSSRMGSVLKAPTPNRPVCRIIGSSIDVSINTPITINYLALPTSPFLDYTIVNGVQEFLPTGGVHNGTVQPVGTPSRTVEFIWPTQCHGDIVNLISSFASRQLVDQANMQTSELIKQRGQ